MPTTLGRQSGVRRWASSFLWVAGIVSAMVVVSHATDPQDEPKSGGPTQAQAQPAPGETEVRKLLRVVTDAYNQADAKALAARFTDDAALFDPDGEEVRGRDAIAQHYAAAFDDGPTCKIAGEVEAVRFLTPDVASVVGRFQLEDEDGTAVSSGRYSLIAVRKEGEWRLAELRDTATTTATSSRGESPDEGGPLQDLEWLLGDWVDEGEDAKATASVRWDADQKFLVRKYSIRIGEEPARSGTQWIGWDPQANQIRSWAFDSEGGFGQGQWTRSGNSWIVKASGVTGDGLTTTATQVIEQLNKDAVKFQSKDRIVGEELLPDIDEAVMVRQPPAAGTDRPAPSPTQTPEGEAPAPKDDRR